MRDFRRQLQEELAQRLIVKVGVGTQQRFVIQVREHGRQQVVYLKFEDLVVLVEQGEFDECPSLVLVLALLGNRIGCAAVSAGSGAAILESGQGGGAPETSRVRHIVLDEAAIPIGADRSRDLAFRHQAVSGLRVLSGDCHTAFQQAEIPFEHGDVLGRIDNDIAIGVKETGPARLQQQHVIVAPAAVGED